MNDGSQFLDSAFTKHASERQSKKICKITVILKFLIPFLVKAHYSCRIDDSLEFLGVKVYFNNPLFTILCNFILLNSAFFSIKTGSFTSIHLLLYYTTLLYFILYLMAQHRG
jgi:hypothetical protein